MVDQGQNRNRHSLNCSKNPNQTLECSRKCPESPEPSIRCWRSCSKSGAAARGSSHYGHLRCYTLTLTMTPLVRRHQTTAKGPQVLVGLLTRGPPSVRFGLSCAPWISLMAAVTSLDASSTCGSCALSFTGNQVKSLLSPKQPKASETKKKESDHRATQFQKKQNLSLAPWWNPIFGVL